MQISPEHMIRGKMLVNAATKEELLELLVEEGSLEDFWGIVHWLRVREIRETCSRYSALSGKI
jgi:hypothetical protein